MGPNEEQVVERFERDAEILRGLGAHVTTEDLRAYGEERAYAAMADSAPMWPEPSPFEEYVYAMMNLEAHFGWRHESAEIREHLRENIRTARAYRRSQELNETGD